MSHPGLDRRDADPALADLPGAGPAAPPPGKKSLTAMLPPKGEPTTGHALIVRPEVPPPRRTGAAPAPADDPFGLHLPAPELPAPPAKRTPSADAVKAIEEEEAPPPAPPPAPATDGE